MSHLVDRIHNGQADWATVELLNEVAHNIQGKCLCALGEFSVQAVITSIERFGEDFKDRVLTTEEATGTLVPSYERR
jgi:NADH-quinone oxidoreductase subunit F